MNAKSGSRHKIVILNYGSQYTQLIARRIREQRVYSEILPFTTSAESLKADMPQGIILSGGPSSVFDEGAPSIDPEIFNLGVPVLGVCYGMQLMCHTLGGKVVPSDNREYGKTLMTTSAVSPLIAGLPRESTVWMSHGDMVSAIPDGFATVASSANCPFAAIANEARRLYAIQFHPEVVHTEFGGQIIKNFLFSICACRQDWNMGSWIDATIERMRSEVGDGEVILGLSGGVDSSVVAVLLDKAIGSRLHCIFVDNGLLRHNEVADVENMFRSRLGLDLHVARAAQRFYAALKGVEDPEAKRKIIGREFITVFAEEARKFKSCKFLAQGTIYPDVIESSSSKDGPSQTIKSQMSQIPGFHVRKLGADREFNAAVSFCIYDRQDYTIQRQDKIRHHGDQPVRAVKGDVHEPDTVVGIKILDRGTVSAKVVNGQFITVQSKDQCLICQGI